MKPRKIVQITHTYYGHGECGTFALADDGTVWGWNWWVNDASYATPVTVYVMKSGTDESCFASAGQLGWWKAMQLPALGGLWQRIPEPELPKEGE